MYGRGKTAHNAKYNNPEYIGQRFGRLTVLEIQHVTDGKYKRWMWKCKCDCGDEGLFRAEYVSKGHTTSCGCAVFDNKPNLKHGESQTRLFIIWRNMRNRCNPEKTKENYHFRYGGRGIKVCDEWNNYESFAKWARENGYNDDLTLERKDNDGDYCPENCTWTGRKGQARNRNTTLYVNYLGRNMSLAEACEISGTSYKRAFTRIKYMNWPVKEALEIPSNETRKWKRSDRFCKSPI